MRPGDLGSLHEAAEANCMPDNVFPSFGKTGFTGRQARMAAFSAYFPGPFPQSGRDLPPRQRVQSTQFMVPKDADQSFDEPFGASEPPEPADDWENPENSR